MSVRVIETFESHGLIRLDKEAFDQRVRAGRTRYGACSTLGDAVPEVERQVIIQQLLKVVTTSESTHFCVRELAPADAVDDQGRTLACPGQVVVYVEGC